MPFIEFSGINYFPDMHCSLGEHMGYRRLSDADKSAIVPIFGLTRRSGAADLADGIRLISDSAGENPFLLDLDHRPAPAPWIARDPIDPVADARRVANETASQIAYNAELARLLNSADGFAAWREFCTDFPTAAPFLQYTDPAGERLSLLRQASQMSRGGGSIALRIKEGYEDDFSVIIPEIISVIDDPQQLLLIFDCGQGRQRINERADFARRGIRAILGDLSLSQQAAVKAVCMSNSFNAPTHSGLRSSPNLDWRLWRSAREAFPFAFGDYAATPRLGALSGFVPRDWRATVVFPQAESWLMYRSPNSNDAAGWVEGAAELLVHDDFQPVPDTWGAQLITQAAGGNLDGADSARYWYASKVNLHINRQIRHAAEQASTGDEGGD